MVFISFVVYVFKEMILRGGWNLKEEIKSDLLIFFLF